MPTSAVPSASTSVMPNRSDKQPGGNLERGQRAGKASAQQPDLAVADAELLLPDRQHHIDEIGVAVVQGVHAAGHAERAALIGLGDLRRLLGGARRCDGHDAAAAALDKGRADERDHRLASLVDSRY